jgi:hypothetical protein
MAFNQRNKETILMKVYIKGTKKQINEQLANGESLVFTEFNAFNPNGYETEHGFSRLPQGTYVAFYQKLDGAGFPVSIADGSVKEGRIK